MHGAALRFTLPQRRNGHKGIVGFSLRFCGEDYINCCLTGEMHEIYCPFHIVG
jgi:hypothetical protein